MTPEQREKLVKTISFAIGMAGTFRPEGQAEAAVQDIEKLYDIKPKETTHGKQADEDNE